MKKYTTISAKISEEEGEKIKKLGLNPTVIIRKAVQEEIRRAKNKDFTDRVRMINHRKKAR